MEVTQPSWSQQRLEAALLFDALEKFEARLAARGIQVVRLKGASLVPRFYPDPGDRHLCDVDVLIRPKDLSEVEEVLRDDGYVYHSVIQWSASRFRKAWFKNGPGEIPLSIDVHTAIYWNQPPNFFPPIVYDPKGYYRLEDRFELLHLIINWVEQDSCVEIAKLRDIYFYITQSDLDWSLWLQEPMVQEHWRSILIAQLALRMQFGFQWGLDEKVRSYLFQKILNHIFTKDFLINPKGRLAKYVVFRLLTRPLAQVISYHCQWLWAYGPALTRQFFGNWFNSNFK